jgi:hypothetical protein
VTEILEHGTIKILDIIDGDLLRNSVMIDDVLPKKILNVAEVILVTGFTSTHLVKYSTAMMVKV